MPISAKPLIEQATEQVQSANERCAAAHESIIRTDRLVILAEEVIRESRALLARGRIGL